MNQDNTPDRAGLFDDEIPTYERDKKPTTEVNPKTSIYERAGRAAPQSIPAAQPNAAQPKELAEEKNTVEIDPAQAPESTAAAAQPAPETQMFSSAEDSRSQPLASDAPTSMYDPAPQDAQDTAAQEASANMQNYGSTYGDEDFAPATQVPTGQAPATEAWVSSEQQQYDASAVAAVPAVAAVAPTDAEDAPAAVDARRGTIDFGLAILRLVVGLYLILFGITHFFNLGGTGGINGLEQAYTGYALGSVLAIAIPAMMFAGGVFLVLGLLTPVAAAIVTAAAGFNAIHELNAADSIQWLNLDGNILFAALLAVVAVVIQFTGPGTISFDVSRSWAKRPLVSSWVFAIIGIAGAVALWWFGAGVNPLN